MIIIEQTSTLVLVYISRNVFIDPARSAFSAPPHFPIGVSFSNTAFFLHDNTMGKVSYVSRGTNETYPNLNPIQYQ